MNRATARTTKGRYHKIGHASILLKRIDVEKIKARCHHCKRLFDRLGQKISDIRAEARADREAFRAEAHAARAENQAAREAIRAESRAAREAFEERLRADRAENRADREAFEERLRADRAERRADREAWQAEMRALREDAGADREAVSRLSGLVEQMRTAGR